MPLGPAHSAWWFPCSFWAMHRTRGTPEPSALCPAPPHGRGEVGRGQQRFQVVPERARKKRHDSPGHSRQSGGGAAVSRGTGGPEAGRAFPEAALSPPGGPGACWSRLPGGRAVSGVAGAHPHTRGSTAHAHAKPRGRACLVIRRRPAVSILTFIPSNTRQQLRRRWRGDATGPQRGATHCVPQEREHASARERLARAAAGAERLRVAQHVGIRSLWWRDEAETDTLTAFCPVCI